MPPLRGLVAALLAAAVVAVGVPARAATNDVARASQWGLDLINAEPAWATGTGAGITIAVVDSGVDLDHEDLQAQLVLPGYNAVSPGQPPQDDHGHGTHVAGIAAAQMNNGRGIAGVAPGARILPVKAFSADENGKATASGADIEEAVRWSVDNGAKVINMSFGEELVQPVLGPGFRDVIEYAWSKGVVSVVAAGNGGRGVFGDSGFSDENAVVVSAVNRRDAKPGYSSSVGDAKWGVAAPGGEGGKTPADENVISTYWNPENPGANNFYAYMSGTSMAAPHVSGAIAVLLSLGLSPTDAINRVRSTAKDIGDPGEDEVFGAGRLDLARAVAGLKPAGGGPPNGGTVEPGRTTTSRGRNRTTTTLPGAVGSAVTTTAPTTTPVEGNGSTTTTTGGLRLASPPSPPGSDGGRPWAASALSLALLVAVGAGAFRLRPSP